MKKNYLLLLVAFCLLCSKNLFSAEDTFFNSFNKGFKFIYNFEFKKADSLISEFKKKYSSAPQTQILSANYFWWKIRSGEDTKENRKKYSEYLDNLEKCLDKKKEAKQISYEDVFHYINLYSYRARMELLDNHYIKALSYTTKCNAFITLSSGLEESYKPFNLTSGLYNCFMSMAKQNHPFFAPYFLFVPSCDKEKGLKQLEKCSSSSDVLLQTEANYFLMILYGEGEIDYPVSASYAEKLSSQYPNNLLYQYYLFKVNFFDENFDSAMKNLIMLYQKSKAVNGLTDTQRKYFTDKAGKDMQEYYKKHPTTKSEN